MWTFTVRSPSGSARVLTAAHLVPRDHGAPGVDGAHSPAMSAAPTKSRRLPVPPQARMPKRLPSLGARAARTWRTLVRKKAHPTRLVTRPGLRRLVTNRAKSQPTEPADAVTAATTAMARVVLVVFMALPIMYTPDLAGRMVGRMADHSAGRLADRLAAISVDPSTGLRLADEAAVVEDAGVAVASVSAPTRCTQLSGGAPSPSRDSSRPSRRRPWRHTSMSVDTYNP